MSVPSCPYIVEAERARPREQPLQKSQCPWLGLHAGRGRELRPGEYCSNPVSQRAHRLLVGLTDSLRVACPRATTAHRAALAQR